MEIVFKSFAIAIFILLYIFATGILVKNKTEIFKDMNSYLVGFIIQVLMIMLVTLVPNFFHLSWMSVNIGIWAVIIFSTICFVYNYRTIYKGFKENVAQGSKLELFIIIVIFLFIYGSEIFIANGQKLSYDGGFWLPTYTNNIGLDHINSFIPYSGDYSITFFKNYVFNSYSLVNSFLIANSGLNVMNTTGLIIPAVIGALYVSVMIELSDTFKNKKISGITIFLFLFAISYFLGNWKLSWIQLNMFLGSAVAYVLIPMLTGSQILRLATANNKTEVVASTIRLTLISILGIFFTTTSVYIGGYMLGVAFVLFLLTKKQRLKSLHLLWPMGAYLGFAILSIISTQVMVLLSA
ncbi:MAG: DUF6077 domain-containing protein [Cellulosilyticaceae bacterium]